MSSRFHMDDIVTVSFDDVKFRIVYVNSDGGPDETYDIEIISGRDHDRNPILEYIPASALTITEPDVPNWPPSPGEIWVLDGISEDIDLRIPYRISITGPVLALVRVADPGVSESLSGAKRRNPVRVFPEA